MALQWRLKGVTPLDSRLEEVLEVGKTYALLGELTAYYGAACPDGPRLFLEFERNGKTRRYTGEQVVEIYPLIIHKQD